jgi:2-polyprenyl-6-methoxyphenol hydroxylase-like FAD-dependent oxidoreductase
MSTETRDHAVVLGGSIAGLFAARVLAETYHSVTIVERDQLALDGHRRGVPQSHHVHALLARGRVVAEELFPGLTSELTDAGGISGDILENVRRYFQGRVLPRARVGHTAVSASRPLIEGVLRRRVLSLPNVSVVDGHEIVGICSTVDGQRITGARVTSLYGLGSRILPADLVVDCTGRGSRCQRWLADLGFTPPSEDRIAINMTYASCLFAMPPEALGDDMLVMVPRHPTQLRGGAMQRIEGGQALVTLHGVRGERPPLDPAAFAEYALALPVPDIHDAIRAGKPIGRPAPYRVPTYLRRRYEYLSALPAGLLVAGDAVCVFNPVYGQGMSVAAVSLLALRDELSRGDEPDPRRFFAHLAGLLDAAWGLSVGADLATPGISAELAETPDGQPPRGTGLTGEYLAALQRGAADDVELAKALVRVNALVDPPSALLQSDIVERVARVPAPVG